MTDVSSFDFELPVAARPIDSTVSVAMNMVTSTDVDQASLASGARSALYDITEAKLDSLEVTNQKNSGRCWMFAAFNVFRHRIARELGLENFEFSESYLQFYDLLGKAEVFWEQITPLIDDLSTRRAQFLLENPVSDGGEWNYVVALVKKYGVVPKYAMPETYSSSKTPEMVRDINTVLRRGVIRELDKDQVLSDVRSILVTHLGEPPQHFVWQYRDKDEKFHRVGEITPQDFAARVLPDDLGDYVILGNDPRPEREYGVRYSVDGQYDVPGEQPFTFLNAEIADLAEAAKTSISNEEPVWFACDVNRQFYAKLGIWDADLLQRDQLYGIDTATSKAEQMATRESVLTHAMVLTGFDHEGTARWRVENSWGTEHHGAHNELSDKGYGTMSQRWFDDNVFAIAVRPQYVPEHLRGAIDSTPEIVPPWDAMG